MAHIRPFFSVSPTPDKAAIVSSLPNDVFSEDEARRITEENELSFLKIVRPETLFPVGQDPYTETVYAKASAVLNEWKSSGILQTQTEEAFYVYRLIRNSHFQTGIVALSSVDDYLNGICKKHEHTVTEKENDRTRHIMTCRAQTGPIFLTYRPVKEIKEICSDVQKGCPMFDFTSDDGISHTVWKISDSSLCCQITSLFSQVPCTYIADGHHRAAAAARTAIQFRKEDPDFSINKEYNWFLSVLFPSDELEILDYNRIVLTHNSLTNDELLHMIEPFFNVSLLSGACKPEHRGVIHMYTGHQWYCLAVKSSVLEARKSPVDRLDVSILQDVVLSPVLGIKDPRTDNRIQFIGGVKKLEEIKNIVDSHKDSIAFIMFPTSIDDLMDIADNGEVMPPKSTWFEPKLRSGLFVHEI